MSPGSADKSAPTKLKQIALLLGVSALLFAGHLAYVKFSPPRAKLPLISVVDSDADSQKPQGKFLHRG